MNNPAADANADRTPDGARTPPGFTAPTQPPPPIPDHELLHLIGRGSYGQVWLARNRLGTWRAVKIVSRDAFEDRKPFEREFKGIQRLEPLSRAHDGLVDILQVGGAEDYFYYVMELADDAGKEQRSGVVEEWNDGVFDQRTRPTTPSLHHSNTPSFQDSTIPSHHHCIFPSLHFLHPTHPSR